MSKPAAPFAPPDQLERQRALDSGRSILVQAPAGSGTMLLKQRIAPIFSRSPQFLQLAALPMLTVGLTGAAAVQLALRCATAFLPSWKKPPPAPLPGRTSSQWIHSPVAPWRTPGNSAGICLTCPPSSASARCHAVSGMVLPSTFSSAR